MSEPIAPSFDVVIVGARCAGASLAMLLARAGISVLAVDRAAFGSDTLSTHFLWPRTTGLLAKWGLLEAVAASGCPPIEQVTADYGPVALKGRPSAVDGTAAMYCPRRTVLDRLLVEAARGAGAEMRDETTFRELLREGSRARGVRLQDKDGNVREVCSRLVVGADGLWSPVARAVGAATDVEHETLTCGYYAYWSGVPTSGVEFYVRQGSDILVFPTHAGLTCIWAGRARGAWEAYRGDVEGTYHGILALAPGLAQRVVKGARATPFRGTSKLPNFYRRSAGAGWALVGDAAYHRDPLTGMGIGDAFLGADLLATAVLGGLGDGDARLDDLLDGRLADYQTEFRRRTQPVFDYTVRAAGLADPSSALPLYARIAESAEDTTRFMDVLAGALPFKDFFNPVNLSHLMRR
ncbi:MAG: NAD(P)/FAD-dependent oxidoreductase [Alphaproteobacteria bacterium]|nr:NAD(P)/FAD-dependent oxidoreductase [Alphaproteobacteria bacterium]